MAGVYSIDPVRTIHASKYDSQPVTEGNRVQVPRGLYFGTVLRYFTEVYLIYTSTSQPFRGKCRTFALWPASLFIVFPEKMINWLKVIDCYWLKAWQTLTVFPVIRLISNRKSLKSWKRRPAVHNNNFFVQIIMFRLKNITFRTLKAQKCTNLKGFAQWRLLLWYLKNILLLILLNSCLCRVLNAGLCVVTL